MTDADHLLALLAAAIAEPHLLSRSDRERLVHAADAHLRRHHTEMWAELHTWLAEADQSESGEQGARRWLRGLVERVDPA